MMVLGEFLILLTLLYIMYALVRCIAYTAAIPELTTLNLTFVRLLQYTLSAAIIDIALMVLTLE